MESRQTHPLITITADSIPEAGLADERRDGFPLSSAREESDRETPLATRTRLLEAARAIADTLNEGAFESDRQGDLAEASVAGLAQHGFWRMRLCREMGGPELPIVTQIEVIAAQAAEDTSSAWCTMVANNGLAMLGGTMPAAAVERVFAEGVPRCSIVASAGGSAAAGQCLGRRKGGAPER